MTGYLLTVDLGAEGHPAHVRLDSSSKQLWHTTLDRATVFDTVDAAEWHLTELQLMTPTATIGIIEVDE